MKIEQLYEIYLRHPSIQTDSRQLKKGDLFFALKGLTFNGNTFAARALELGAAYAIIDEVPDGLLNDNLIPPYSSDRLVVVEDVLQALQDLALHHRRQFSIPFIAITGSNGKTTTKELIHAVLSSTYTTYTTKGNLNNHIGIPLTLLSVRPDAQFAVIEMGANHQKEIEGYCRYALPTHGIITNVGKAHLEGFGGPEGVKKGKGELFDFLRSPEVPSFDSAALTGNRPPAFSNSARTGNPSSTADDLTGNPSPAVGSATRSDNPSSTAATAFVLRDSPDLLQMSRGIPHVVTYGAHDADYTGSIQNSPADTSGPALQSPGTQTPPVPGASVPSPTPPSPVPGIPTTSSPAPTPFLRVAITHGATTGPIQTQLVGDYNFPNVLVAVAVGKHFGVPDSAIRQAIEAYTPSNSRSQLIERDGNHIILDAYNANPSSMRVAIENFARLTGAGFDRKVLILGAMAELGPESVNEHRAIVDLIRQYPWRQVVLVGGDFLKIDHPWLSFPDSRAAAQWLRNAGLKDVYLLVKGSRSMKMEEVFAE